MIGLAKRNTFDLFNVLANIFSFILYALHVIKLTSCGTGCKALKLKINVMKKLIIISLSLIFISCNNKKVTMCDYYMAQYTSNNIHYYIGTDLNCNLIKSDTIGIKTNFSVVLRKLKTY